MAVHGKAHAQEQRQVKPPRLSEPDTTMTARTHPGAKGKGLSYNGEHCANTRTRESVRVLTVDVQRCGEDLTDAACQATSGAPLSTSCSRRLRRRQIKPVPLPRQGCYQMLGKPLQLLPRIEGLRRKLMRRLS